MNFGLALYSSTEFNEKANRLAKLSDQMKDYFSYKDYGNDVKSFVIGVKMFDEQAQAFFKKSKPKYKREKRSETHDGLTVEFEKAFEYEVWLDLEKLRSLDNDVAFLRYVSAELLTSISELDNVKSIKDFDKTQFKSDLTDFFHQNNIK